jgi:hypothetical protein
VVTNCITQLNVFVWTQWGADFLPRNSLVDPIVHHWIIPLCMQFTLQTWATLLRKLACDYLHLIKINCRALWLDESTHSELASWLLRWVEKKITQKHFNANKNIEIFIMKYNFELLIFNNIYRISSISATGGLTIFLQAHLMRDSYWFSQNTEVKTQSCRWKFRAEDYKECSDLTRSRTTV